MSHVKGPFVLDFQTPNSLVRPINFYFKYFRAKICHFNLLRNHHSFLRQGVNNTWQFKKELLATVAAPAKPLDSQTNDQSILNVLRLYFRCRKTIYILKFELSTSYLFSVSNWKFSLRLFATLFKVMVCMGKELQFSL